jgi:hypothetical protein
MCNTTLNIVRENKYINFEMDLTGQIGENSYKFEKGVVNVVVLL